MSMIPIFDDDNNKSKFIKDNDKIYYTDNLSETKAATLAKLYYDHLSKLFDNQHEVKQKQFKFIYQQHIHRQFATKWEKLKKDNNSNPDLTPISNSMRFDDNQSTQNALNKGISANKKMSPFHKNRTDRKQLKKRCVL